MRPDAVGFFVEADTFSVPLEYLVADCERKAEARSGIVAVVPLDAIVCDTGLDRTLSLRIPEQVFYRWIYRFDFQRVWDRLSPFLLPIKTSKKQSKCQRSIEC